MAADRWTRIRTPLLVLFAASGWGWALMLKTNAAKERADGGEAAGERASSSSVRDSGKKSLASMLPTNRSARLLAQIGDISDAAQKGEVNEKFIRACRETLLDSDQNRRRRDFALLMDFLRPEDAVAMHEAFLALHREGRGFGEEYAAFASRWGEVDGMGALGFLSSETPVRMPTRDFGNIVRGWAQVDPQAAMTWMKENPDLADGKEGWSAVIKGWMKFDSKAALDYLIGTELPPNQKVDCIRYAATEKQFSSGVDDAVDWIVSLPDEGLVGVGANIAWQSMAVNLNEMPYDHAADIWSRIGDKPWMRFDQFAQFAGEIGKARVNEEGVGGFVNALDKKWSGEKVSGSFSRWMQMNPEGVTRWLDTVPDGPFKDAAMRGVKQSGITFEEDVIYEDPDQ